MITDRPLFITMMEGIGDTVYQRPFVRAQAAFRPVYINTPWPELFSDIPGLHFVKSKSPYRTQAKNVKRLEGFPWEDLPRILDWRRFVYTLTQPGSVTEELERHVSLDCQPFVFDLPDFGPPPVSGRYAVIRPATVRSEWKVTSRNCHPAYLTEASKLLSRMGYTVVCVADIDGDQEWLVGEMPPADIYYTKGELEPKQLFSLMQHAAVVTGPVGWIVPVSLAYRTPAVIIGGGLGHYNAYERLVDKRMDDSRFRLILPDNYCKCRHARHECPRTITGFAEKFTDAVDAVRHSEMRLAA